VGNAARHELREIPMVIRPRRGLGAIEPDGQTMSCRTNGEAALPAKRGDAMVEIHLAGTMGRSDSLMLTMPPIRKWKSSPRAHRS
jgi:hypothetical protein